MGSCFVCDEEVKEGIFIAVAETCHTQTAYLTKISQLVGNEFMVIAKEDDEVCKRCASLFDKSDELEKDLMEIHNKIKNYLNLKYELSSTESDLKEESDIFEVEITQQPENDETLGNDKIETISISQDTAETDNDNIEVQSTDKETTPNENVKLIMELLQSSEYSDEFMENTSLDNNIQQDNGNYHTESTVQQDLITEQYIADDANIKKEVMGETNPQESNYPILETNEIQDIKQPDTNDRQIVCITNVSGNIKTEGGPLNINLGDVTTAPLTQCVQIVPKIIKSEDLLQLGNYFTFETIDPGSIIQINKIEDLQQVENFVEVASEIIENPIISNKRGTNRRQKVDPNSLELYSCDVCGKLCTTKNRLDMHKTIHEKRVCDYCGQTFSSNYRLKIHTNIHTRQKKYTCNVCGKIFIHHSTYWYHRKWHDNPYPYSCEFCEKKFKHSSILAIHRRKHTGEKPYACSFCDQTFAISTTLKKHELLHTQDFEFSCDVCHKGFTSRSKYSYHMTRAHKPANRSNVPKKNPTVPVNVQTIKVETSQLGKTGLLNLIPPEVNEDFVVGPETLKKYKDISFEVIKKECPEPEQTEECQLFEIVNTDQLQLEEGVVEIVLGSENMVLSESVLPEEVIITEEIA